MINWTFLLLSLSLVFLFHLISRGHPISFPLQSMHLRNLAFFLEPVAISHLLNYYLYTNPRSVLLWSTALMYREVLQILLSIFLTESSLKLPVSSTIQTSIILYSLSPIVILLQIFPFSTAIFVDIALRKS